MKIEKFFLTNYFKNKKSKPTVRVGLCLGGGGARGIAHLGALKAFEEYGIDFDFVVGCSAGALVGAFYCAGMNYQQIYDIAKTIKTKDIRSGRLGIFPSKNDGLIELIKNNIPYENIEDLPKKFCAVAVDLVTATEKHFDHGKLAELTASSCCVPAVFEPVRFDNMVLVDGGVMNNLPADVPKKFGCDYVISVDVNSTRGGNITSGKMIDSIVTSFKIMMKNNSASGYLNSDILIKPDTKRFKSTKPDGFDEMVEEGYLATVKAMPQIMELMNGEVEKKSVITNFFDN